MEEFGGVACEIEDCETRDVTSSTVGQFFSLFGTPRASDSQIVKLKVCFKLSRSSGSNIHRLQDWPPSDRFRSMFPQLQEDFERAVPLPAYTGSTGVKNLAAHFPENANPPDLGKLKVSR